MAKYGRQSGPDRVQFVCEQDMIHIYPLLDFSGAPSTRALVQWAAFINSVVRV